MNQNIFNEMLKLIAQYDWAVETQIPEYNGLTKEEATKIRNGLVNLTKEIA